MAGNKNWSHVHGDGHACGLHAHGKDGAIDFAKFKLLG